MKGSLSFSGCKDVSGSLKRLEVGSSLSIAEILAISSILTIAARPSPTDATIRMIPAFRKIRWRSASGFWSP